MENKEKRKALVYVFDMETLLGLGTYQKLDDDELMHLFAQMHITRDKIGAQDIIIINSAREGSFSNSSSNKLIQDKVNRTMIESWYSMAKIRRLLQDKTHRVVLGRCFYKEGFATFAEPNSISESDLFVAHSVDKRPSKDRLLEYIDELAMEYNIKELIVVNDPFVEFANSLVDPPLYEGIPVTLYSADTIFISRDDKISMIESSGTMEIEAYGEPLKCITECAKLHNENMTSIINARNGLDFQKKYYLNKGNKKHE